MPLAPISSMMASAEAGGYAVGYFESWSIDSLQGVIDAAEQKRSAIIIGFNGEFLSGRAEAELRDIDLLAATGRSIADQSAVPVGLIFNECGRHSWTERAIDAGFNLVMPAPGTSVEEVRRLADLAHSRNVAIEAEALSESEDGTDPDEAALFVQSTGIDLLAIEAGNEEIRLEGRAPLDLDRIRNIRVRTGVPLVLHGGTGIEDSSLRGAIERGVRKVNYGTYMKQHYLRTLRDALTTDEPNPHVLLGGGVPTDIMVVGRNAVRDAVLERIDLLGSCGRA